MDMLPLFLAFLSGAAACLVFLLRVSGQHVPDQISEEEQQGIEFAETRNFRPDLTVGKELPKYDSKPVNSEQLGASQEQVRETLRK